MIPLSHCAVPISNLTVLLSHIVVPLFFLKFNDSIVTISSTDRPNKYHCPDEPIKYHRPPRPSMDNGRSPIKRNIQYLKWSLINQEDHWRPIKAYIEWAQRHYKRGTYATINRVQRLEEKMIYIRYTLELKKVHTHTHTHTEILILWLFTLALKSPFCQFHSLTLPSKTPWPTPHQLPLREYSIPNEARADLSGQTYLTDDLGIISCCHSI